MNQQFKKIKRDEGIRI